jgi:uncharacterized protein YdbL (DUF1318 family)
MKTSFIALTLMLAALVVAPMAQAAADLEINTPAVTTLKNSMQARHNQLAPYYASGAIGLTRDGMIAVRDAAAVPLAQRQNLSSMVSSENADRNALYKEIANANGHPEWEAEVRTTFAQRWIQKAQSGWYVQEAGGWTKK